MVLGQIANDGITSGWQGQLVVGGSKNNMAGSAAASSASGIEGLCSDSFN